MCTISWFYSDSGYEIFFNRDEQKTRQQALPPTLQQANETRCIMPIDPEGNGTWISVNEYGVSFALLNYYQGRLPKGRLKSRGQLVRSLAHIRTMSDLMLHFDEIKLDCFAPFSLLCFPNFRGFTDWNKIPMMRWTGKELVSLRQESPLISSSFEFSQVYEERQNTYDKIIAPVMDYADETDLGVCRSERRNICLQKKRDAFYRLHASHKPRASAYSICMHRDDAQTVSFSHIEVKENEIRFHYSDGAPCEAPVFERASLSMLCAESESI